LKICTSKKRFCLFLLRPAPAALLVFSLALAPYRAVAQQNAPVSQSQTGRQSAESATVNSDESATRSENPNEAQDEKGDAALLHSPVVKAAARMMHLKLDTAMYLMLGINFAIIFLAIAVPLVRVMPKVMRKRSETLSQSLKDARVATADAKARLSAVETKLAGLDEEMKKFRAQIEQESLEDEKRIKASISEESARIVAAAEQEIGVAAAAAKRGLRSFAAGLAIEHAEKQLALTPETDRALIAEFVASVGADGAGKGGKN
jgi:F-type H+-transporting ATPase subunit b